MTHCFRSLTAVGVPQHRIITSRRSIRNMRRWIRQNRTTRGPRSSWLKRVTPMASNSRWDVKKEPPWEVAVAQALAEQCKPAGINIKINVMPNAQYWEIWDKTPFGFTAWTHRPLGVMVHNLAYRSGVPWNESHHNDPEYDSILDLASATLDVNERRKHMAKLQAKLQQNGVIAQPLWRSIFAAGHKKVQGYKLHPTNYHQLNKVSLA